MGSPDIGSLWPFLQWQTSATKTSGSWGSPVHPCQGHHSSLLPGPLALCMHHAFQQQDGPLPSGLPCHHWLHWHSSVWNMQGLVHHSTAPVGKDLPRFPLPADRQQSPGLFNFSQAYQGHRSAART